MKFIFNHQLDRYLFYFEYKRFKIIHDGGTHRPALMFDVCTQEFIDVFDLDVIVRPVLEKYVEKLNTDYVLYQIMCEEYLNL